MRHFRHYIVSRDKFQRCHWPLKSLNPSKTEIMWLGTSPVSSWTRSCTIGNVPLLSMVATIIVDSVRNLGVIIDCQLSLDMLLCRSGYYQLRQLRSVAWSLSIDAAKTLVHAFVFSRLDYCNALPYGVSDGCCVAYNPSSTPPCMRLVTGARRRDHITPIL